MQQSSVLELTAHTNWSAEVSYCHHSSLLITFVRLPTDIFMYALRIKHLFLSQCLAYSFLQNYHAYAGYR
jgi:hypothetical protein